MTAPSVVASTFGTDSGNTLASVVTTPTNLAGDVIYILISSDAASQTFTAPAGFSTLYSNVQVSGNTAVFACFYKTSNGSEPSTYTVNVGTSERQAWVVVSVRGDGGVGAQGTNATGNSSTATIPAITTPVNDCLVFGIVVTDGNTYPHGSPADYSSQIITGGSSASTLGWQRTTKTTAGTVSANTVSLNISEQWLGVSFAIQPVSGTNGAAAITLGALTTTAAGKVAIVGTGAVTLDALTVAATDTVGRTGIAAVTLAALTSTGTGHSVGPAPIVVDRLFNLSSANTTTVTVVAPLNEIGDIIYIAISSDAANQVFTPPAGFSTLYNNVGVSGNTATFALFFKPATASEPSTYTIGLSVSERQAWVVWSVRNDGGIDAIGTNATGSSSTATIPAITTTVNDCLVFGIVITDGDTYPLGTAADYTNQIVTGASSASTLGWQYTTKATAGTISANTVSLNISEQWLGVSFAIKPIRAAPSGAAAITLGALTITARIGADRIGAAAITLGALAVLGRAFVPDGRFPSAAIAQTAPPLMASNFQISIESAAGVKLGGGPLLTGIKWSYKQKLSLAGEWSLDVPLAEPRAAVATLKRRVHCYVRRAGRLAWLGGGIIESRGYRLSGQSIPVLTLSGPDLLRELVGTTVKFEISALDAAPRARQILATILAATPAWTVTIPNGLPEITARFVHESVLAALTVTCAKVGAFFWMEPYTTGPRKITIATTPVASNIVATNLADPAAVDRNPNVCLISDIEETTTSWDAINRLIVYGAGEGQARLTLAMATQWPDGSPINNSYLYTDPYGRFHGFVFDKVTNTITDTLAVAAYGQAEQAAAYKEIAPITNNTADMIAAANTLVVAAVNQLVLSSFPSVSYRLSVAALRAVVHPGMQIRVVARKVRDNGTYINIDTRLIIQEVDYEADASGEKVTGLTVATTWKAEKTGATILSEQIAKLTALEAHPQTGANTNTISYREDMDDDYGATFPFWLSSGTQQVNSITLRYRLEKLRSTVKTIGGTASGSVTIPSHQHRVDIPPHAHNLTMNGDGSVTGNHPLARVLYFNPPDHKMYFDAGATTADATTSEAGGGATVTSESGGGQTGLTVDISSALSAVYGVHEDPAVAYTVGDLDWAANGIAISRPPLAIGGGWYEVDITSYLTDISTGRPLLYNNTVSVAVKPTSKTDKRVRVTAQIELRTTIQTLANA